MAVYQTPKSISTSAPYGTGNDQGEPKFSYEPIDVSLIAPRADKYDVEKAADKPKETGTQASQH